MANDKGATFIRGSVPKLRKVNLVTQWGWVRPHIHQRESDVVVPPMLKVGAASHSHTHSHLSVEPPMLRVGVSPGSDALSLAPGEPMCAY